MAHPVRFPTTFWTTLRDRPDQARAKLFTRYRTAIYHYLLNQGFQESDAEDVAQEVFLQVCQAPFLDRVDRAKGKFRTLLLAVTRNLLLKARERGARRKALSIDSGGPEGASLEVPGQTEPDVRFDEIWVQNLVRLALQRLQEEASQGGPPHYQAIVLNKLQGLPYSEVARKLHADEDDVTNWIHHGKKKMRRYLEELVRDYCSSEEEWKEELELFGRHFT